MAKEKFEDEKNVEKYVKEQEALTGDKSTGDKPVGAPIQEVKNTNLPWQKSEEKISLGNELGWQKLKIEDLPTRGLFYPEGTEIAVRAASAGEIRHWSTLDETNLSNLDDMLNYVIERCVNIKSPGHSSWRDIKEVDRFYIILAIHEFTFLNGENKLQVSTSETKKIDVVKEMVDYIQLPQEIMKHYDDQKRCLVIQLKDKSAPFEVTMPSIGVTNWVKSYVIRKRQLNQPIEEDFVSFAPFVILDWKGLADPTYEQAVMESETWSNLKISALSYIKDKFVEAVEPVVKYQTEDGGERQVPLNFQGGIKSIFIISNPFG